MALLDYRRAAKRLGCCKRTAWQLVKDGLLPALKIGRLVRIDPVDLEAFIQRSKNGQQTPGAKALAAALDKLPPAQREKVKQVIADRQAKSEG